jgi:nucleoside phosphorylase
MIIEDAINYFKAFRESKLPVYFEHMKEYKVWPEGGYPNFYKDNEVVQCLVNIYCNLDETYADLRIPQAFTSDLALVQSWERFYNFLKDYDKLFDEIRTHLDNRRKKGNEITYPTVFAVVYQDRHEVLDVLKTILEFDNIKKLTGKSEGIASVEGKLTLKRDKSPEYDIAIITVIYETEFIHIKNLLHNPKLLSVNDPSKTIYYSGSLTGKTKEIKVLLACSNQMGMPAASSLTTKIIYLHNPKLVAMCGISAGIKGEIGDILAPDILWDYGSGKNYIDKIKTKWFLTKRVPKFDPYRYPEKISSELTKKLIELSYQRKYLDEIRSNYPISNHFEKFPDKISLRIGPYASGSAVIANEKILAHIKSQDGKLIGFDMEAYGVIYAVNNSNEDHKPICIILKSISDYGDSEKNNPDKDKHQDYAAYTSANYLVKLLEFDID